MYDPAINHRTSRPVLDGAALDSAIDEARAELAALLRAPGGGEPSRLTGARALLGSLLDRRVALTAARLFVPQGGVVVVVVVGGTGGCS